MKAKKQVPLARHSDSSTKRLHVDAVIPARMFLVKHLMSKDARANQLFEDLFDEVLPWLRVPG